MNMDRDASTTDEYFVTALQIFYCCGADGGGTLRVDALMEKFAPFVKTDIAEYSYLKSLLDPEHNNPEITVSMLAHALNQYSESQKSKVDFDESFNNSKSGPMPQDSDSGISTDAGYQLLEELQCELREKSHMAMQLRSQLDFTDRQHEEAIATITAERDSLKAHLNILREENVSLSHVRNDYEEASERLCASETALAAARRDLDAARRRDKMLQEQLATLEVEKATLQELLSKSKEECHRINEMYLSRQSALREDNELLRTERAELGARLQDQDEFMQQLIKEKVLLEMELKEMVNKSNQSQLYLNRSAEVSYTEEQLLTALDPLRANSQFDSDNRILDEESFANALREDQGRSTNMSLFDEIRLSLGNVSHNSIMDASDTQCENCDQLDNSLVTIGTQTDEGFNDNEVLNCPKCNPIKAVVYKNFDKDIKNFGRKNLDEMFNKSSANVKNSSTQTDDVSLAYDNNNCGDCFKCLQCDKLNREMQTVLDKYDLDLYKLQRFLNEGNERNVFLKNTVDEMKAKIDFLEDIVADQKVKIDSLSCSTCCVECQTIDSDQASVSTQAEIPCTDCEKRKTIVPQRGFRRYLWDPLKCLFQVFAVIMFVGALSVLYGVSRRAAPRCERDSTSVPWRWLDAQEFMDLLLRIEYVADVPM